MNRPPTIKYDRNEWYTPDWVLGLARDTLGTIDLDPASCATANAIVQARRFYDKATNGLVQPWSGRIWCNPPYSRGLIDQFATKLIEEYDTGNVAKGLFLVNNATETGWFQSLLARFPACFLNKRVDFWHSDRGGDAPRQGQAIFYVGADWLGFQNVWSAAGVVVGIDTVSRIRRACDPPRPNA